MTEWRAESVLEAEALDDIDLKELSHEKLETLAGRVAAEQERRWRKREKQAVKDAMNTEPKP
jgi:DNA-binding ferritin-like protein (Dps family)